MDMLVYLVDPTNRPMLRLLRRMGVELRYRDGLVEGHQPLAGQPAALDDRERLQADLGVPGATPSTSCPSP